MTVLRALARESELRGYSKLRKAELIAFLQDNERRQPQQPPQQHAPSTAPQQQSPEIPAMTEGPLTKRQCKRMQAKDSKLAKMLC